MAGTRARRLVVLGAMSFAAVGVAVVLPGAVLPLLIERLGLQLSDAGALLAAQPLGHLCTVLLLPYGVSRVDSRWLLGLAGLLLGSAVAALGWVSNWQGALLAMLVSGASIGALEVGANTVLLLYTTQPNRVLNLAHLFFGVASVLTPALAASAVEVGLSWKWLWSMASVPVLAAGLSWLAFAPIPGARPPGHGMDRARADGERRWPTVALAMAMAAYVGAEIGFGSWYTKYLTVAHEVPFAVAGRGLALYWGGLTVGRLLLSLWAPGHGSVPFVTALGIASAAVGVCALAAPGPMTFVLLSAMLGVTLAGIFPGLLALAARWHPAHVERATGALLAGAGCGQMLFPWAMAWAAAYGGVARAMWLYPALCLLVSATVRWGERIRRRQRMLHL